MATTAIGIEALQRAAVEYDEQLHELPSLMLEPFAARMHFDLMQPEGPEFRRINVRRNGGLVRPYQGTVAQVEEREALRAEESVLRMRPCYVALIDNVQNYREKTLTMRAGRLVDDRTKEHPYAFEILRAVVQTFVEDITLAIPHAKWGSANTPLGALDGYNSIIDGLIAGEKIAAKHGNLVACDPIEAGTGPEDVKALEALAKWLRGLSPTLLAGPLDVIIPQEKLRHVLDAYERQRRFTGEISVAKLEEYLTVKASIGGKLSLLTGPEVGTGDRLIAQRPGNITIGLSGRDSMQFVQVRAPYTDPNLAQFWIQGSVGTMLNDWHAKVFATSGGSIAQREGLAGDYQTK